MLFLHILIFISKAKKGIILIQYHMQLTKQEIMFF